MKTNRFLTSAAFLLAIVLVVGALPACDEEKPVNENLPTDANPGGQPPADMGGAALSVDGGTDSCGGCPASTAAAKSDGCGGCESDAAVVDAMVPAAAADGCGGSCGTEKKAGCGDSCGDDCGDKCSDEKKKECDGNCDDCGDDCPKKTGADCCGTCGGGCEKKSGQ